MVHRRFQTAARVLVITAKMVAAIVIPLPVAAILTHLIVFRLNVGELRAGEALNTAFVIPLTTLLRWASVPDAGLLATTAGSLVLSVPYALMVTGLFVWLRGPHKTSSGST